VRTEYGAFFLSWRAGLPVPEAQSNFAKE
jgi:hypothetical protein